MEGCAGRNCRLSRLYTIRRGGTDHCSGTSDCQKPSGIALSAIDSKALTSTINKAVEAGIPVVLFDADAPDSKAYSFLATNNYNAGVAAADKMAQLLGREGEIGIVTQPGQQNHDDRSEGFRDTLEQRYPGMSVVEIREGKGDTLVAKEAAADMLDKHPDLKGIFVTEASGGMGVADAVIGADKANRITIIGFDTNKGTLDRISDGTIAATIAQGRGIWAIGPCSICFICIMVLPYRPRRSAMTCLRFQQGWTPGFPL